MRDSFNVDDLLLKVLQQDDEDIEQFIADALQQQLGIDKLFHDVTKFDTEFDLEKEFDTWLGDNN